MAQAKSGWGAQAGDAVERHARRQTLSVLSSGKGIAHASPTCSLTHRRRKTVARGAARDFSGGKE